ncbi:Hemolymph lipopolysaccharide-binding protein [Gryllus bimaculatus]|nr:Hemolymph lipopolysaccharide-binding protein [Gryllus bimaculatus]
MGQKPDFLIIAQQPRRRRRRRRRRVATCGSKALQRSCGSRSASAKWPRARVARRRSIKSYSVTRNICSDTCSCTATGRACLSHTPALTMMFDRRLYFPLAVFVTGLLAVIPPILCGHPPNVIQRTMKVSPGQKIIQTTPIPSTFPPVTSTEPARKETSKKPEYSTKAPRHHHQPPRMNFEREDSVEDSSPYVDSDGSFHPSYEEVPGVGVYRLHARPRSWEEARKACEREGAQLAVPNSRTEALALMDIHNRCPRLLPSHFNDYQYLGVHDLYSEGDWETVVGDPLNETGYVVWGRNQPDNAHHHGENCLSMNRNGFFNDVPCWTELPFICEHP